MHENYPGLLKFIFSGTLPNEINKLRKLESLQLSTNALQTFNLSTAAKMKNLKSVNLCKNKIKQFPVDLCSLPNVDAIDLSDNLIKTLPGDEMKSLRAI